MSVDITLSVFVVSSEQILPVGAIDFENERVVLFRPRDWANSYVSFDDAILWINSGLIKIDLRRFVDKGNGVNWNLVYDKEKE